MTTKQILNFTGLKSYLREEHGLDAQQIFSEENGSRVFNLDESGFSLQNNSKLRVIAEKGIKNVFRVAPDNRQQITVLLTGSASGFFTKPFVIFPGGERAPRYNVPAEHVGKFNLGWSKNGWITSDAFFEWFANSFYKEVKDKVIFPIIVLMDGHTAHINVDISEFCRDHGIILYCLPAHASHIMQPLDVGVFSSLKLHWNSVLEKFEIKYKGLVMGKSNFFTSFGECWDMSQASISKNIKAGFRKSGLVPLNPESIDYSKILNEKSALNKYQSNVVEGSNHYDKVTYKRILNIYSNTLSQNTLTDFEYKYNNESLIDANSTFGQMYTIYKKTRDLFEKNTDVAVVLSLDQESAVVVDDSNFDVIHVVEAPPSPSNVTISEEPQASTSFTAKSTSAEVRPQQSQGPIISSTLE